MMPNITRGDRMAGLVSYLVGPGRSNEHTEPHLVGGNVALMAWWSDNELNRDAAADIARHLDAPKKRLDVDVSGGHVWHCSLSLRAEEGALTDDRWGAIAEDFLKQMGMDDAEGTKGAVRWAAFRHGVSSAGNDHIHIAVNLVREDGTKISVHNDFRRAQDAARKLESKYGLEELESVRAERSTRGYHPAEMEAQARSNARGKYNQERYGQWATMPAWEALSKDERAKRIAAEVQDFQPKYSLAVRVRAAHEASASEDEFVRRMRQDGLLVRPRLAAGTQDVVTGYSVAARPAFGERPIWYGGGNLARDLTLIRLRSTWADTPQGASAASAEWLAAMRGKRPTRIGREGVAPSAEMFAKVNADLKKFNDELRAVPLEDRDTWVRVAKATSGALASWSRSIESTPGHLAEAAHILSRSAQTFRQPVKPKMSGLASVSGAALLLASAARGGQGIAAQMIMLRQLAKLAGAVYSAAKANGERYQAAAILAADTNNLRAVHAELKKYENEVSLMSPDTEAAREAVNVAAISNASLPVGAVHKKSSESVVPTLLEPYKKPVEVQKGPDSGR